jgi:hypothetical protein
MSQHFNLQAFLWMRAMVEDSKAYLVMPCVRGGTFLGGKGHLFVNENATMPIQEMEQMREHVSNCDGEQLGAYSNIAVLLPYNAAIEKNERHHMDIRNNYRREDFAGRLTHSPEDFKDLRDDVYHGAAILNLLFNWDHPVTVQLENRGFAQHMASRVRNYHVHETLTEVWDDKKGGWKTTTSYHPWGNTENENCADIQQSLAAVVWAK